MGEDDYQDFQSSTDGGEDSCPLTEMDDDSQLPPAHGVVDPPEVVDLETQAEVSADPHQAEDEVSLPDTLVVGDDWAMEEQLKDDIPDTGHSKDLEKSKDENTPQDEVLETSKDKSAENIPKPKDTEGSKDTQKSEDMKTDNIPEEIKDCKQSKRTTDASNSSAMPPPPVPVKSRRLTIGGISFRLPENPSQDVKAKFSELVQARVQQLQILGHYKIRNFGILSCNVFDPSIQSSYRELKYRGNNYHKMLSKKRSAT